MTSYFLAPCAVQFRSEVNTRFPNRDKTSDGWIGDPSHAARPSEHNPCWGCSGRQRGIVMATDTDIDDGDSKRDLRREMINELIGDPRVWYIISNGIIYSRTFGWRARKYTGTNGHWGHVHVSFLLQRAFDIRPFFGKPKPPRGKPAFLDISKARAEYLRVVEGGEPNQSVHVARTQKLLNARLGTRLKADGIVGTKTLNKWAELEGRKGEGRPRVPDETTLRRVNKGMFRLVA